MRYTVRSDDALSFTLCENDKVKSVLQNLLLLLTTRKGSVPMYRDFGLSQNFVDKPVSVAQALMVPEVREAMTKYEPRAEFVGLSFEYNESMPGRMIAILEVEIDE